MIVNWGENQGCYNNTYVVNMTGPDNPVTGYVRLNYISKVYLEVDGIPQGVLNRKNHIKHY